MRCLEVYIYCYDFQTNLHIISFLFIPLFSTVGKGFCSLKKWTATTMIITKAMMMIQGFALKSDPTAKILDEGDFSKIDKSR